MVFQIFYCLEMHHRGDLVLGREVQEIGGEWGILEVEDIPITLQETNVELAQSDVGRVLFVRELDTYSELIRVRREREAFMLANKHQGVMLAPVKLQEDLPELYEFCL